MVAYSIGRYEVTGVAGSGGFATVYEGLDPRLDAKVAIKVLAENWSQDPDVCRRFRQEAVLMRRLRAERNVPGLVEIFDIDERDGQPFFVMGWADRGTLSERVAGKPRSIDEIVPIVESLTQTLGHLHAAEVVHRDIKPSNLLIASDAGAPPPGSALLNPGERLLVGDLGLAKELSREASALSMVVGTERYMAPEQRVFGGPIDHRVDIYSSSALIRELVSGRGSAPVPAALAAVLEKGTAESPADRHGDMMQWRDAILAAVRTPTAPTVVTSPPEPRAQPDAAATAPVPAGPAKVASMSRAPLLGAAALVVAIAVVAGAWLVLRGGSDSIAGPATIVSGNSAEYTVTGADPGSVRWTDPSGQSIISDSLQITGRLPGELSFSASVDDRVHTRAIEVEEAPDGPTIDGPGELAIGQSAIYRAKLAPGQTHYWIHPTQGQLFDSEIEMTQASTEFVLGLVAVDGAGIERGTQLRVTAEG